MVVLFVTPILIAFGLAFGAGPLFYLQIAPTLVAFVLPPAAAGILLTVMLLRYLPARRTHQMLTAVGVLLGVSLVTLLRLLSPERLLRASTTEDFEAVVRGLTVPASAYLPSTWTADLQLAAVRGHWGIENKLHWVMDVVFGEDQSRARAGYAAQNLATLRRLALNLLKREKKKRSVRGKQLDAGWDNAYLLKVLGGDPTPI